MIILAIRVMPMLSICIYGVGGEFGHQVGILFHNFVIHKTLNFSTPGKSDK